MTDDERIGEDDDRAHDQLGRLSRIDGVEFYGKLSFLKAGVFYALWWGLIALFGASLVGLFAALPPALLATVAGTALLGSMAGAMGAAVMGDRERFAAAGTLAEADLAYVNQWLGN